MNDFVNIVGKITQYKDEPAVYYVEKEEYNKENSINDSMQLT